MTAPTRDDTTHLLRDGIAAAQAGNKVRARLLVRQVLERTPENEIAWLWLANLAPDSPEAIEALRQVLALNPENATARVGLAAALARAGATAAQAGDKAEARRLLTDATALDPKNEALLLWLAGVADTPHDAVRYLNRCLEINPESTKAKQGLKHYHAILGTQTCPLCQAQSAVPLPRCLTCRAVVTLADPAAFDAQVSADAGMMTAAVARLAPAAMKAPGGPAAFHLGMAYLNMGQPAEAIKVFNAAALRTEADARWKDDVRKLAEHWRAANQEPTATDDDDLPPRRLVLVVDDSPTVRKLVAVALQPAGCQVVSVSCAERVPAAVEEHGIPDLFVLDINLPGLDGFQLCKILRKKVETSKVPVVFLTGKDGFLNKLRGQWAGAAEYLTKPFQPKQLIDAVAKVLDAPAGK